METPTGLVLRVPDSPFAALATRLCLDGKDSGRRLVALLTGFLEPSG